MGLILPIDIIGKASLVFLGGHLSQVRSGACTVPMVTAIDATKFR